MNAACQRVRISSEVSVLSEPTKLHSAMFVLLNIYIYIFATFYILAQNCNITFGCSDCHFEKPQICI